MSKCYCMNRSCLTVIGLFLSVILITFSNVNAKEKSSLPTKGEKIENFELKTLEDKTVKLHDVTKEGPVVLLVLRGYPGYQCPLCTFQVADFVSKADEFKELKATVLLVYPGPADDLKSKAKQFTKRIKLPRNFKMLLDPDYHFLNQYDLRWDAKRETSYPSTFVIDQKNIVTFSKVSKSHGGRTRAKAVLKAVKGS